MIRNLTPHAVQIITPWGNVELQPDPPVARLRQRAREAGSVEVDGTSVDLFDIAAEGVDDLPPPRPDTWLVVSRLVAETCPERSDLVFPYGEVRDHAGRVIGCTALGRPLHDRETQ
jgi:hypothetical protein